MDDLIDEYLLLIIKVPTLIINNIRSQLKLAIRQWDFVTNRLSLLAYLLNCVMYGMSIILYRSIIST